MPVKPPIYDFHKDLRHIYENRLRSMGRQPDSANDTYSLGVQVYDLLRRYISSTPRQVCFSDRMSSHSDRHGPALNEIRRKAEKGLSLTAHLSRAVASPTGAGSGKTRDKDLLMVDWGLHHLHLSINVEADGFVSRTENVLFAKVTEAALYFVDVLPHGKGKLPWVEVSLLETIDRNWPRLLDHCRLTMPSSGDDSMTPEERHQLRRAGVATFTSLPNGTVLGRQAELLPRAPAWMQRLTSSGICG